MSMCWECYKSRSFFSVKRVRKSKGRLKRPARSHREEVEGKETNKEEEEEKDKEEEEEEEKEEEEEEEEEEEDDSGRVSLGGVEGGPSKRRRGRGEIGRGRGREASEKDVLAQDASATVSVLRRSARVKVCAKRCSLCQWQPAVCGIISGGGAEEMLLSPL